jgi:hypothetical protein
MPTSKITTKTAIFGIATSPSVQIVLRVLLGRQIHTGRRVVSRRNWEKARAEARVGFGTVLFDSAHIHH